MKVGDMIKVVTAPRVDQFQTPVGLLIRIGKRRNNRPVGTVLTCRGIESWPLDSYYEYEVINESR